MIDVQRLLRKGIKEIYIEVSSAENIELLFKTLIKIKFFTNTNGWISRNPYSNKGGPMRYLVLNLISKDIVFNRSPATVELFKTKLFVKETEDFINAGPKKKLLF